MPDLCQVLIRYRFTKSCCIFLSALYLVLWCFMTLLQSVVICLGNKKRTCARWRGYWLGTNGKTRVWNRF